MLKLNLETTGQLVGAYVVLYIFFGCWMAMHMGVYMSTTSDECKLRNGGNVCVGESKFDSFRKVAITSPKSDVRLTCPQEYVCVRFPLHCVSGRIGEGEEEEEEEEEEGKNNKKKNK